MLRCVLMLLLTTPQLPNAVANDNRVPAGVMKNSVLTVQLEARKVVWRPDREADAGLVVYAFGERGKAARIPGPLIRVPAGTLVRASITNRLDRPLKVHGFIARPAKTDDTLVVASGSTREIEFRLDTPGNFYYYATVTD